jgi:hypothetical protein
MVPPNPSPAISAANNAYHNLVRHLVFHGPPNIPKEQSLRTVECMAPPTSCQAAERTMMDERLVAFLTVTGRYAHHNSSSFPPLWAIHSRWWQPNRGKPNSTARYAGRNRICKRGHPEQNLMAHYNSSIRRRHGPTDTAQKCLQCTSSM